jgi:hypothetical protein
MTLKSLFLRFLKENNVYTTTVVDKIISPSNDDVNVFVNKKNLFFSIQSYGIGNWIKALRNYFGVNNYYSLHRKWKSLCEKIEISNCNINVGDTIRYAYGFNDLTVKEIDLKSKKILCKNENIECFIPIYAIRIVNKKKFVPFNDIEVKYKYRNKIYE